jgi:hypothetical protein
MVFGLTALITTPPSFRTPRWSKDFSAIIYYPSSPFIKDRGMRIILGHEAKKIIKLGLAIYNDGSMVKTLFGTKKPPSASLTAQARSKVSISLHTKGQ